MADRDNEGPPEEGIQMVIDETWVFFAATSKDY